MAGSHIGQNDGLERKGDETLGWRHQVGRGAITEWMQILHAERALQLCIGVRLFEFGTIIVSELDSGLVVAL